jgi:hypothetical protein
VVVFDFIQFTGCGCLECSCWSGNSAVWWLTITVVRSTHYNRMLKYNIIDLRICNNRRAGVWRHFSKLEETMEASWHSIDSLPHQAFVSVTSNILFYILRPSTKQAISSPLEHWEHCICCYVTQEMTNIIWKTKLSSL